MGDVVVPRVEAADKALEQVVAVEFVFMRVDQADVIVDIVGHVAVGLDADYVSGFVFRRVVNQFDELLGLAGTFHAHNQSNHSKTLLSF